LLLVVPTTAQAAEVYVGFGVGSGVDATTLESGSFEPESSGDRFKLLLGWDLGQHLGVEAAYYDFGKQRLVAIADYGFDSSTDGYSAAVSGRLPFGRVTLFGKVGLLTWQEDGTIVTLAGSSDFSEEGTDLVFGAGLRVRVARGFELRGEWERFEFGEHSSDGIWGTILYRF